MTERKPHDEHDKKMRKLICSKLFMFLIGAVNTYYQVVAEEIYVAELMVESNITLEIQTILSIFNNTSDLQVTNSNGASHTVNLQHSGLVAECVIFGKISTCNCSDGYIWSNEVCYNFGCCNESTCYSNISHIVPLCVAKVRVYINGSVTRKERTWASATWSLLSTMLKDAFGKLNGFEYLNIAVLSHTTSIANYEAAVSVKFATSKLQGLLDDLETSFGVVIEVNTVGMVTIGSPQTTVCYQSSPMLICTFEEATSSAKWTMSTGHKSFELNNGSIIRLNHSCSTEEYKSCVAVTLHKVTGIVAGTYECRFTSGSVVHTAKTQLNVELLPDTITLKIDPLTVDCALSRTSDVNVTAIILSSTARFDVWWSYMGIWMSNLFNKTDGKHFFYTFTVPVSCKKTTEAQSVNVTFKNIKKQKKSARVDIPVIYVGEKFCTEDEINGEIWPNTPDGDTVINRTCPDGRVGYRSRTCQDTIWQPVYSMCIKEELDKVLNTANNFLMGLGAPQKMAKDIFQGLINILTYNDSNSSNIIADIGTSVNILNMMARSSENVPLQEEVFPDFVNASSNMLMEPWAGVNDSTLHNMSSSYLKALEDLVKNIKVNRSTGFHSQNLELKFCSSSDCNLSVFDIKVVLRETPGILKTVAVKNLTDKLRNNFGQTMPTGLLISATIEHSNYSSIGIRLDFPKDQNTSAKAYCVFWNTTVRDWSDAGCVFKTSANQHVHCECNHLTSFSVLMAKTAVSDGVLDIISNVGLGVSVCSLLTFLIIECLVWSAVVKSNLSHFRHTALVNIAMFRLLADCSFLASTSPKILSDSWCLIFTICKHLFYLAMFSWMLCMSVMLVHQLIFVFSPLRKRVFMFFSSIIGYVCPILIVGCSYVYSKYTNKPYYDRSTCWLVYEKLLEGSTHAFLLPVAMIMLTNLFSMMVVIVTLIKSSVPDGSNAHDIETAKSILKVVVFLTPVFGITWIIGFVQLILEDDNMLTIAYYSFTILNSFQGLFIFLTGCFTEQKVREELMKLIMEKRKTDSLKNSTLVTDTNEK